MSTSPCNCSDATACEALPPVIEGARVVVVNDANCLRYLVPVPGSVLYTDGTKGYYSDGSTFFPLALPNLVSLAGDAGAEVPSLLFQTSGGVIGALRASETDNLFIYSLNGQWNIGLLPVVTSWPVATIPEECCCPTGFLTVTLDVEEENLVLGRFNPCTDATTVASGPILTCEEGCIRKLAGTSDDQVPVWDNGASEWVPTEISTLIPTPDSVLDTAQLYWEYSGDQTDVPFAATPFLFSGAFGVDWTVTQSGSIVNTVLSGGYYTLRIVNAGWHTINLTFSGSLKITGYVGNLTSYFFDADLDCNGLSPIAFGPAAMAATFVDPNSDAYMTYAVSCNVSGSFTANQTLTFQLRITGHDSTDNVTLVLTDAEFTHRICGNVTRIT